MSQRCTIWLPAALYACLQQAADTRGLAVSGAIRQALASFLDSPGAGHGTPQPTAQPVADVPHKLHHCLTAVPEQLPPRVHPLLMVACVDAAGPDPSDTAAGASAAPSDRCEDIAPPRP
jgi:hypothetical protein